MNVSFRQLMWALLSSVGVLWPALTVGLGSCVVFFYRGVRMRNWRWLIIGAVALAMTIFTFAMMPDSGIKTINGSSVFYNLVVVLMLVNWFGSTIVALALNPRWLRFLIETSPMVPAEVRSRYGQPQRQRTQEPLLGQQPDQQWWTTTNTSSTGKAAAQGTRSGFSQAGASTSSDITAGPQLPVREEFTGNVEVNQARPAQLRAMGLRPSDIDSILSARKRIGSFNSFEELLESSGVAPHVLLPLRSRLEFSGNPTRSNRRGSRTLDL